MNKVQISVILTIRIRLYDGELEIYFVKNR